MGNRAYGLIEPVDSAFDWIKWFEPSLLAAALGGDGGAASAAVRGWRDGDSVACCHADDTLGPERATPAVRGASSSESAQWVAPPRPRIRRGRDLACARVRLSAPARRKQCDDLAPGRRPTLRSA